MNANEAENILWAAVDAVQAETGEPATAWLVYWHLRQNTPNIKVWTAETMSGIEDGEIAQYLGNGWVGITVE